MPQKVPPPAAPQPVTFPHCPLEGVDVRATLTTEKRVSPLRNVYESWTPRVCCVRSSFPLASIMSVRLRRAVARSCPLSISAVV